jgi:flagellar hook-associated protein 3 FlgL
MSMRVTNNMVSNRVLADLQSQYATMAKTQEQVSTSKRVNRPSDDPTAAAQARLRTAQLAGIKGSQDSVDSASTWLGGAETALTSINDILQTANELTLEGVNGSMSQENRNGIADQIDQLIKSTKDTMNAKLGDAYIFSGTKSDTPPYTDATGDVYQGDNNPVAREAGAGVALQVNPSFNAIGSGGSAPLTGDSILGGGAASGDGRVLATLEAISAHLRSGTTADLNALSTTDLTALKANQTAVSDAHSMVGAMTNRATAATQRLSDLEDATTKSIDDLVGLDTAKALISYTSQQAAYQASLKVGAQIIQPSLLDFLS